MESGPDKPRIEGENDEERVLEWLKEEMERQNSPEGIAAAQASEKRQEQYNERNARQHLDTTLRHQAESLMVDMEIGTHSEPLDSIPSFESRAARESFVKKKIWDELVEPILEYESLKEDIEKLGLSNTKKKVEMQLLNERRAMAEDELRLHLPGFAKLTTDDEKADYLKRVSKTIHTDKSFHP